MHRIPRNHRISLSEKAHRVLRESEWICLVLKKIKSVYSDLVVFEVHFCMWFAKVGLNTYFLNYGGLCDENVGFMAYKTVRARVDHLAA